jgi:hypothetical protein
VPLAIATALELAVMVQAVSAAGELASVNFPVEAPVCGKKLERTLIYRQWHAAALWWSIAGMEGSHGHGVFRACGAGLLAGGVRSPENVGAR